MDKNSTDNKSVETHEKKAHGIKQRINKQMEAFFDPAIIITGKKG